MLEHDFLCCFLWIPMQKVFSGVSLMLFWLFFISLCWPKHLGVSLITSAGATGRILAWPQPLSCYWRCLLHDSCTCLVLRVGESQRTSENRLNCLTWLASLVTGAKCKDRLSSKTGRISEEISKGLTPWSPYDCDIAMSLVRKSPSPSFMMHSRVEQLSWSEVISLILSQGSICSWFNIDRAGESCIILLYVIRLEVQLFL